MGLRPARLSILIYHRVPCEPDPLQPELADARLFARHMRWLGRFFNVLALPEAAARLRAGTLPPRAVAITFDDGYADNAEVALPILQELGLPATFFIATGFLDGGRMWNDTVIETVRRWPGPSLAVPGLDLEPVRVGGLQERRAALRRLLPAIKYLEPDRREAVCTALAESVEAPLPRPMMRSVQVRELARAGMTIGAHTRSHPILTRLSAGDARRELEGSRVDLEAITGARVTSLAYPNGKPGRDYTGEHVELARQLGFTVAVTTAMGTAGPASDPLQLPRFPPWDRSSPRYLARLFHARLFPAEAARAPAPLMGGT